MTTPESKLKSDIKAYLKANGIFWAMVQGGAFSKPGDPDMLACVHGRFVAIEGKTYEGSMRPLQEVRKTQIEQSGGVYVIARTVDDVRRAVDAIRKDTEEK